MPVLRQIANLWTLIQHPSADGEWTLDQKLEAIAEAGFDGVCWAPGPELRAGTQRLGLMFVGGMASNDEAAFPQLLRELKQCGAEDVNVQLGSADLLAPEALRLACTLLEQGEELGLKPAIETHRGTCTETPEKYYALADEYERRIGRLLPTSWDFSHFAIVKHTTAGDVAERLLVRPDILQASRQFHFRPFNGHHAQVPVTGPDGQLTPEFRDWRSFAEAVLRCWLDGNRKSETEILICPELGPVYGGYALSTFPNSWEDTKVLRREIQRLWAELVKPVDQTL